MLKGHIASMPGDAPGVTHPATVRSVLRVWLLAELRAAGDKLDGPCETPRILGEAGLPARMGCLDWVPTCLRLPPKQHAGQSLTQARTDCMLRRATGRTRGRRPCCFAVEEVRALSGTTIWALRDRGAAGPFSLARS